MVETLQIEGHSLGYIEHNPEANNPLIIYLHGILNTVHIQENVLKDILEGQHWIALSLPGHYPSQLRDGFQTKELTPEFIGRILSEAVRQLTDGRPVRLIGHSTGGFASFTIAYIAPELVESLCIVDGFAQGRWHSLALRPMQIMATLPLIHYPFFIAYMGLARGNRFMVNLFISFISHNYVIVREKPDYSDSVSLITSDASQHITRNIYHYFHNMSSTDIRDWLGKIQSPVMILHGENDPVILPEHAREMHSLLPDSKLKWFSRCGHDPFSEVHEQLKQAIQEWYTN